MPPVPESLDADRHEALAGRRAEPWIRRGVLVVLLAVLCLGLAGALGQRAHTSVAEGGGAELRLHVPSTLRGGDIFEMEMRITSPGSAIAKPRLELGRGWLDGITINSQLPQDDAEESAPDGGLVMAFGPLAAGDPLTIRLQMQVNPTTIGRRDAPVVLRDGGRELARVDRQLTILP